MSERARIRLCPSFGHAASVSPTYPRHFMLKRGFSFAPGYRLEQFLGRGQFGQVWRASAPGGTAAAIKFIDLSGGEGAKEHEGIKRVKQIRHANLMPITAIWLLDAQGKAIEEQPDVSQETVTLKASADPLATADSLPPMSSPHVSLPGPLEATGIVLSPQPEPAWLAVGMLLGGKSLQHRLRECVKSGLPGIPPKELLSYMDESAKGLDFLNIPQHDLGEGMVAIQHCDVKPANIVLIGSSAVVCDFGLARILSRNQVTATSASGTPAYMAPEAIAGRPSKTSDQYSLAVTYYHLRTGTLPVNDGTLWEVLDAHRTGKLDLSRVPEQEHAVLKRATALEWDKRFDSNLDFIESLREALRVEGHTRPIIPASVGSMQSPASMPTAAIDPSMTLMPGQALAAPPSGAGPLSGPTVGISGSGETQKDTAFRPSEASAPASGSSGTPVTLADLAAPTPLSKPDVEWWLSPKWLLAGATGITLPIVILVAAAVTGNGESESQGDSEKRQSVLVGSDANQQHNSGVTSDPQKNVDEAPKTPAQLLTEALALIQNDEASAIARFSQAATLDPSLLEIEPSELHGHQGHVTKLTFSGDGKSLVSMADDKQPYLWPLAELEKSEIGVSSMALAPVKTIPTSDTLETIAIDSSGKLLATANFANEVSVIDLADPTKPLRKEVLEDATISLAWHPFESTIVAATLRPSIVFMSSSQSKQASLFRFDVTDPLRDIAIEPSGNWLITLSEKGMVSKIAWDEMAKVVEQSLAPKSSSFTSEGSAVTQILPTTLEPTVGNVKAESVLVAGGEAGEITLWSLGDGSSAIDESKVLSRQEAMHKNAITALAVSSTGASGPIVSGDDQGTLGLWRSSSKEPTLSLPIHREAITSLDLTADGRWLVAASLDGDVTLWDLRGDDLPMLRLRANAGPANSVQFDPTERWIAVGHDKYISLWDFRHARLGIGKIKQPTESVPKVNPSEQPNAKPNETAV